MHFKCQHLKDKKKTEITWSEIGKMDLLPGRIRKMTTTLKKRKQRTGNKNGNVIRKNYFYSPQNGVFWCVKNPEPGHGVFKAKMYRVYQEVGDEEEEVGAAETSQQVVEDAWHWPDDGDDDGHHRDGGWRYWWWPSSSWLLCEQEFILLYYYDFLVPRRCEKVFLSYVHNSVTQLLISI